MTEVKVERQKIAVGGERLALLSGEVHYWRLAPEAWRPVLQRVREMGLGIVASYVPWDYHEIAPEQFDFQGETDPRRNLPAFLDLLTKEDFWIILRPGPYIYSEWLNHGVPDRAACYHRLDPNFQAMAQPYMEAVVEIARPYLATNGGRIILFQADNEIDPWPHWYIEQLGLGNAPGPFQRFLEARYGTIEALNQVWNSEYPAFHDVRATRLLLPDQPEMMRRYLDFIRFRHAYVEDVARWAVGTYRDLGVDVPISLNTYSGVETQHAANLEQIADVVGPDIYPSNEFAHRANEHRNFLDAVRYTRAYSRLPHIAEFQSGIWHDWLDDVKVLSPNHYRLMGLSALLAGAVGWNWYMIANRDNWYLSPINEWGRTRPELFVVFQQLVALFEKIDPPSLTKLTRTALTYAPLQRATTRPGQPVLQAFYDAGIDYHFFDVEAGASRLPAPPLLFYAGGPWLSRKGQQRLQQYMQEGGHLICVGSIPRYDAELRPYNGLQLAQPEGVVNNGPGTRPLSLTLPGAEGAPSLQTTVSSTWLFNYAHVPGTPVVGRLEPKPALPSEELTLQFNLAAGAEYTIGYTKDMGGGRLTVIGLEPTPVLLLALHRAAGVPIPVRSPISGISSALFQAPGAGNQSDGDLYLFVVNNGDEGHLTSLTVDPALVEDGSYLVRDLVRGEQQAVTLGKAPLTVFVPRKDGTILHLRPER